MGGQVGSEVEPVSGLFQDWILLGVSELGDSVKTVERSLMKAASNHLENSSHRLGGGVFNSIVFALEPSWQPFSMGGSGPTMQMYYNESRGYPGADVDESIFIYVLASSTCLHHSPLRTWDSAWGGPSTVPI